MHKYTYFTNALRLAARCVGVLAFGLFFSLSLGGHTCMDDDDGKGAEFKTVGGHNRFLEHMDRIAEENLTVQRRMLEQLEGINRFLEHMDRKSTALVGSGLPGGERH